MSWLNGSTWKALADGERFDTREEFYILSVVDCGNLRLPSGRLVATDPFGPMDQRDNRELDIAPGTYPVKVTFADRNGIRDDLNSRGAYASLLLRDEPEVERHLLTPLRVGESAPELGLDEFIGVDVDTGTACFVDAAALEYGMSPNEDESWYDDLFDNGTDTSWFNIIDDPGHIREGIANIPLPLATDGANLIMFRTGWGDGRYPLIGGYDAAGRLVAVHFDFFVIPEPATMTEEP